MQLAIVGAAEIHELRTVKGFQSFLFVEDKLVMHILISLIPMSNAEA